MKLFKVRLSERYGCHMLFIRLSMCQNDETQTSLFVSIYWGIGYGIIYSFLALYNVQTFLLGNTLLTHCWSTVAWNCCYQTTYHDSWRNKLDRKLLKMWFWYMQKSNVFCTGGEEHAPTPPSSRGLDIHLYK